MSGQLHATVALARGKISWFSLEGRLDRLASVKDRRIFCLCWDQNHDYLSYSLWPRRYTGWTLSTLSFAPLFQQFLSHSLCMAIRFCRPRRFLEHGPVASLCFRLMLKNKCRYTAIAQSVWWSATVWITVVWLWARKDFSAQSCDRILATTIVPSQRVIRVHLSRIKRSGP